MIRVDAAVGSKDLVMPLRKLGLKVQCCHLDSADVAFEGRGPEQTMLNIGVELKKVADLIQSIETGRFTLEQLPKMLQTYDHSWLLIEGIWRHDSTGKVVGYSGSNRWRPLSRRLTADELEKRLLTMELAGAPSERKLHVRFVGVRRDTLRFLCALYRWWTDQALDEHKSNVGIYRAPPLIRLSQFRQLVATLPHIGWKRSKDVEAYFEGSLRAIVESVVEDWIALFGEKTGREIYQSLENMRGEAR